jgi:uncharacterized surface protein with fasciclin (FAS1) repeats
VSPHARAAAVVLCLAAAAGWAPPANPAAPCPTTLDALTRTPTLATAVEAFRAAGLADVLVEAPGVTVFAPDEQAFSKIPAEQLRAVLGDRRVLAPIAAYHIAAGAFAPSQLRHARALPTLNGKALTVDVVNGTVVLDGHATVLDAGVRCGNGIVYAIDGVLRP